MKQCKLFSFGVIALLMLGASAGAQAPSAEGFELRHADRLFVRFHGVPELSGEYRVSADGVISVPVIGRIQVSEMQASELEQVLMSRGRELAARDTFVAVEVVGFRPVFVTGYVSTPGAVEWRPGMTVLHAVALSGGLYRSSSEGGSAGTAEDPTGQFTHLRKILDDHKRALVTLAMLRAEEAGNTEVETPLELVELVGRGEAEAFVRHHAEILVARRQGQVAKLRTVTGAQSAAKAEFEGLQQQRARIEEQLRLRRSSRDKLEELTKRGLVRADRSLEETIRVSELEEKLVNIGVALSRVQATLAGLERDALSFSEERRVPLLEEIRKTERQIAQNRIEVEGATGRPNSGSKSFGEASRVPEIEIEYSIVRAQKVGAGSTQVQANSAIWPGDVLTVSRKLGLGPR